jgi:hypothetical protein
VIVWTQLVCMHLKVSCTLNPSDEVQALSAPSAIRRGMQGALDHPQDTVARF